MTQEHLLRIAAGCFFVGGIAVSGYYRARADREGGRLPDRPQGLPSVAFRATFAILVWGMVLLQLIAPSLVPWSLIDLPYPIRWLGLALLGAAAGIVWWTMRSIGSNVSPSISARANARLVTDGPYRWIRHPIYSAGFLMFLSLGLTLGSIPCFVLLLPLTWWLQRRVSDEEESLIASYGDDYRAYMQRTGRFVPRLS